MRLVRRKNNPNKETLMYIHLSHVTIIRVYTIRIAKQCESDKMLTNYYVSTLLLLGLV